MDFLAVLTWAGRMKHILAALDAAGAHDGRVLVLGSPGLARVLGRRGREAAVAELEAALPFDDDSLAAVVAVTRHPPRDEWQRVVRAGGALVLIAPVRPQEMSRRALCAGLTDLRAAYQGRTVILSGRVWKPPRAPAP